MVLLMCAIYRSNGYFMHWNAQACVELSGETASISPELLNAVVLRLVKRGFFDRGLFNTAHVLTSKPYNDDISQPCVDVLLGTTPYMYSPTCSPTTQGLKEANPQSAYPRHRPPTRKHPLSPNILPRHISSIRIPTGPTAPIPCHRSPSPPQSKPNSLPCPTNSDSSSCCNRHHGSTPFAAPTTSPLTSSANV